MHSAAIKIKIQELMYRGTMNVEHEMYDYTSNNCSHQSSNKRFKVKFESHTQKTFNRYTTKDSYTRKMTHNIRSTGI